MQDRLAGGGDVLFFPAGPENHCKKEKNSMKTIEISDVTLRLSDGGGVLSFKERVEIARTLDRLGVDQIELPALKDGKGDVLRNKTIASVVSSARLAAAAGLTEESVEAAWESVKAPARITEADP